MPILGVGHGAPLSEIKRAYRKLAFSLHPDVGDDPDETRFREAHEAYQALMQTEQRRPRRIKVMRAPRTVLSTPGRCTWSRADIPSRFGGDLLST